MSNFESLGLSPVLVVEPLKELSLEEVLASADFRETKKEDLPLFKELVRDNYLDKPTVLRRYFVNSSGNACWRANLMGLKMEFPFDEWKKSKHIEKRAESRYFSYLKSIAERDFGMKLSFKGYSENPRFFAYSTWYNQIEYEEEDWFREKSTEQENDEKEYERRHTIIEGLDFEAVETLEKVFYKALKERLIILLNLESVPFIINNAYDCFFNGVTCSQSNSMMRAKIAEISKILLDKEANDWIKAGNNDITLFAMDPANRFNYIETYQKVLRALTDIRDEKLDEVLALIDNEADPLQKAILANHIVEDEIFEADDGDEDDDVEDEEDHSNQVEDDYE